MQPIVAGSRIGPYRIVRLLGEGGMGAVYEAVHEAISRHVAIKVLHAEYAAKSEIVSRFFNEARAANLIDHPGMVQIFDFGQSPEGTTYIVMEYLRGESLKQRLAQPVALSVYEALILARQIALSLSAAHQKGIVHRDLKPEEIPSESWPVRKGEIVKNLREKARLRDSDFPGFAEFPIDRAWRGSRLTCKA